MSRFARFAFRGHFFQHAGFRVARSLSSPGPDGRVKLPARFLADPVFVRGLGVQGKHAGVTPVTLNDDSSTFQQPCKARIHNRSIYVVPIS